MKLGCSFLFCSSTIYISVSFSSLHCMRSSFLCTSFSSLLCNLTFPLQCIQPFITQGYHFKRLSIQTEETVKENAAGHSCTSTLILSLTHTRKHTRARVHAQTNYTCKQPQQNTHVDIIEKKTPDSGKLSK